MTFQWQQIDGLLTGGLLDRIVDTLECSVCSDIMHVPVVSSCGHSFCYDCCTSWFENKVTCPTCRHELDTPPILNVQLRDVSRHIVNVMVEHGSGQMTQQDLEDLKQRRDDNERSFQYDLKNRKLFGDVFKSVLTMIDRSDGVARCANCHWEAQGSECLNCGAVFRFSRDDDTFYESMDEQDDEQERRDYGSDADNRYDSEDSFIDGRGDDDIHHDIASDNDILSDIEDEPQMIQRRYGITHPNVEESWAGFPSSDEDDDYGDNDVDDLQTAVEHFNNHETDLNDDDDEIDFELTTRSMNRPRRAVVNLSDEE